MKFWIKLLYHADLARTRAEINPIQEKRPNMTSDNTASPQRIAAAPLRTWAQAALRAQSVSPTHAELVAHHLVQTSLWGVDTHGIARLPHYLHRIQAGSIEPQPKLTVEQTAAATATVDGGHGLGMVVCDFAMTQAIHRAIEAGAGVVGARHSTHCGAIGLYGRQAAAKGLIGIAFTHSDAMVAPHGGKHAFLGTNPICITMPCAESPPICLDMATSTIPFNRVINARRDGERLPADVAVDRDGQMTMNAEDAAALMPLAGHKGYALAFMIDMLCGLVNGMTFGPHIAPMYSDLSTRRNLGSLLIAIDPGRFAGGAQLAERVAEMAREARAQPVADGHREVLAPGDPEYRTEQERLCAGIPIATGLAAELQEWSNRLGITPPALSPG
jgi:ureidoglycolate dehydrogenase (NAD+)